MKQARLGEQSGVVAKAFLKIAPSLARRSMCGVFTKGWPRQPSSSKRRSSMRMKTMLGRGGSALSKTPVIAAKTSHKKVRVMVAPATMVELERISDSRGSSDLEWLARLAD